MSCRQMWGSKNELLRTKEGFGPIKKYHDEAVTFYGGLKNSSAGIE